MEDKETLECAFLEAVDLTKVFFAPVSYRTLVRVMQCDKWFAVLLKQGGSSHWAKMT